MRTENKIIDLRSFRDRKVLARDRVNSIQTEYCKLHYNENDAAIEKLKGVK